MPDYSGYRLVTAACSCSEQQAAQNRKTMEKLTRASPARPVAARIEKEWITDSSNTPKT